jgi:hypothetical protein
MGRSAVLLLSGDPGADPGGFGLERLVADHDDAVA